MKKKTARQRAALLLMLGLILYVAACANLTPGKYVKVLDDQQMEQLRTWRIWMGLILGVQYILMIYATRKLQDEARFGWLILNIIGVPFLWTKLGEWFYRLATWIIGWGLGGKILTVIGGLLTGSYGVGNIGMFVIGGVMFKDMQILKLKIGRASCRERV